MASCQNPGSRRPGYRRVTGLLAGLMWLVIACGQGNLASARLENVTAEDLRQLVSAADAEVVLVNMWATWCVPCREEFPALVRLEKEYRGRGLRVVLVSWDLDPAAAREYLAAQQVTFTSYLRVGEATDTEFIEMFEPSWTGMFPATFVYDRAGTLQAMQEGKLSYKEFEKMVTKVLDQ